MVIPSDGRIRLSRHQTNVVITSSILPLFLLYFSFILADNRPLMLLKALFCSSKCNHASPILKERILKILISRILPSSTLLGRNQSKKPPCFYKCRLSPSSLSSAIHIVPSVVANQLHELMMSCEKMLPSSPLY